MNPIDVILWAVALLAVVLIVGIITFVLFLIVMVIRRAVTKPYAPDDHHIIIRGSEEPHGR